MTPFWIAALATTSAAWLVAALVTFRRLLWRPMVDWVKNSSIREEEAAIILGGAVGLVLSVAWPLLLAGRAVERVLDASKRRREKELTAARLALEHLENMALLESDPIVSGSYREQAESARYALARLEAGV